MKSQTLPVGNWKYDIIQSIYLLDDIIDDSDPDNKKPQIIHALQTGEACRKMYPDLDWFHLMGFIHDLGKILAHPNMHNFPQWAVVGDTFPVGCKFSKLNVFPEFFDENCDMENEAYKTKFGIYKEGCGFDNVQFSWGHDEYLYQVLKGNECKLPEEALYVIRYHSFYPWHSHGAYDYLASNKDRELLPLLKAFQKCDLYSKVEEEIIVDELLPYYQSLIRKYFPQTLIKW